LLVYFPWNVYIDVNIKLPNVEARINKKPTVTIMTLMYANNLKCLVLPVIIFLERRFCNAPIVAITIQPNANNEVQLAAKSTNEYKP
jgi:hypothetical protein